MAHRRHRGRSARRDSRGRWGSSLAAGFRFAAERPSRTRRRSAVSRVEGRPNRRVTLQSGEDIWTRNSTEPAAGMLPVGDRVFVGGRDNQFHSLDAKDGDSTGIGKRVPTFWLSRSRRTPRVFHRARQRAARTSPEQRIDVVESPAPMRPFTGPILSGGTLIVAGVASELHAYNAYDGKPSDRLSSSKASRTKKCCSLRLRI